MKFWDLDTQHCFKTIVNHTTAVWDFVISRDDTRLITGSTDTELRFWKLTYDIDGEKDAAPLKKQKLEEDQGLNDSIESDQETDELHILNCTKMGSLQRHGQGRLISMALDLTGRTLCCHGNDTHMEIFLINTDEEIEKRLHKRRKKARKRAREEDTECVDDVKSSLEDEVKRLGMVKLSSKIRSFDVTLNQGTEANVS